MGTQGWLSEALAAADSKAEEFEQSIVGPQDKPLSPQLAEIVRILHNDQFLCEWTLKAIQSQQARLAEASLRTLYGDAEFERMRAEELEKGNGE